MIVSPCCAAPVIVAGRGEGSHWYACSKCGKPLDTEISVVHSEAQQSQLTNNTEGAGHE